ncbi:complement C1q tumor necrosis factor-related protein 6-like [Halichoeres trimaculatus]|uniref:complement C1q tumor necrosis factor-related protein 6-like n=1 Tax=Halichoeres trimaculatus TaxID=147232 RepID=UPI003D9F45E3
MGKLDALMKKFRDMESIQKDLKTRLTNDETRVKANENQILELSNKVRNQVIFSVAAGGGDNAVGPFNTDTTLIYRKVITNIGNAYNTATGIFAAPRAGVYYFNFFVHAGGEQRVFLHLMKNNEVIVDIHDHQTNQDTADNGGKAVFLQLQQGDQVYVRMVANTHVWGGDYGTTFSGMWVSEV